MEDKRVRGANFTKSEVDTLIDIVRKYKDIIENKRTDGTTWKEKNDAWMAIREEFNATCGHFQRSAKTIRAKYESVKKTIRKKCSVLKNEHSKMGGGTSTYENFQSYEEKVLSLTQLSMTGPASRFDNDTTFALPGPSREIQRSESEMVTVEDEDVDYLRNLDVNHNADILENKNCNREPLQQEAVENKTATGIFKQKDKFIHKGKRLKKQTLEKQRCISKPMNTDIVELKKEVLRLQKSLLKEEKENKQTINRLVVHNLEMNLQLKKLKYQLLKEGNVEKDEDIEWADYDGF